MWGGLDACSGCVHAGRPGREPRGNGGAQGLHFHPCMNTTPPPPPPPSFPSQAFSYRADKFTVSCIWVWQQQPSCVWRAQQRRSADTRGGFSVFAVDLGLALRTRRGPANVRRRSASRKVISSPCLLFSFVQCRPTFSAWLAVASLEPQSLQSLLHVMWALEVFLCHATLGTTWYGCHLSYSFFFFFFPPLKDAHKHTQINAL